MDPKNRRDAPIVVNEGIDQILIPDIAKHKALKEQAQTQLLAFEVALAHEIGKKKAWGKLIGGGKFNDDSLRASQEQSRINIQQLSDKKKLAKDKIAHHTEIVDTLTAQLNQYHLDMAILAKSKVNGNANTD